MPNFLVLATSLGLALFMFASARAGEVYKCKDATGHITFTNIKCPEKAAVQHYGTYQNVPDSPDQYQAALDEGQAIRARRAREETAAARSTNQDSAERASDIASIVNRDSRSAAYRDFRKLEKTQGSDAADAKYRADLDRWGERLAGPPPAGYVPPARPGKIPPFGDNGVAPPQTEVTVTDDCSTIGSTLKCRNSDGTVSHGSIDAWGNGRAHGPNGTSTETHRDAFGNLKAGSQCVKDINGQCQ